MAVFNEFRPCPFPNTLQKGILEVGVTHSGNLISVSIVSRCG